MKRIRTIVILLIITALYSCGNNKTSQQTSTDKDAVLTDDKSAAQKAASPTDSSAIKAIQQWLITSTKNYLITSKEEDKIFTPQYIQFKEDGYKVMESEMEYEAYEKKWSKIYGKGSFCNDCPYFISGQDIGSKISVTAVFKEEKENGYWFNVTINDPEMKAKYNDLIKVIKSGSSYLIDDMIMKDL